MGKLSIGRKAITLSSVSRSVRRLKEEGLIEREPYSLHLTEAGKTKALEINRRIKQQIEEFSPFISWE